jgi:flavodoxin
MEENGVGSEGSGAVRSLVVVVSYHHHNTEKIANACATVLGARVTTPREVQPGEVAEYDLVGFGSGIYDATFHASLLDLADRLPEAGTTKAFLFSTYGAPGIAAGGDFVTNNHAQIRERLEAKGYTVIGEFGCAGWNTNSFLKYFGGLNRGRPNADDLRNAEAFAREMLKRARG